MRRTRTGTTWEDIVSVLDDAGNDIRDLGEKAERVEKLLDLIRQLHPLPHLQSDDDLVVWFEDYVRQRP